MTVEILLDPTPAALAAAEQANLFALFRSLEYSPTVEFASLDGLVRWRSAHPYSWFNGVLAGRDVQDTDSEQVSAIIAYFRGHNNPEITWWLEDGVDRAGWDALLEPLGFRHSDGPPGMGVALDRLPPRPGHMRGLEIRPVSHFFELRSFTRLVNGVFGFPPETEDLTYEVFRGMGLKLPHMHYLAYLDGQPVATASAFYGSGVVGIYNVTCLAEARGRGIGAAVTLEPLLDARDAGYHGGILQSSDMGYSIYKRLGFEQHRHIGCYYYSLV